MDEMGLYADYIVESFLNDGWDIDEVRAILKLEKSVWEE